MLVAGRDGQLLFGDDPGRRVGRRGPVALCTEEFDVRQRRLRGTPLQPFSPRPGCWSIAVTLFLNVSLGARTV